MRLIAIAEGRIPASLTSRLARGEMALVWIDRQGMLHDSEAEPPPRERWVQEFNLDPATKTVYGFGRSGKLAGGRLPPDSNRLLSFLIKGGLVDDTWRLGHASEVGRYRDGKWVTTADPTAAEPLSKIGARTSRLDPAVRSLVLFHGTSSVEWERIQKIGLMSMDRSGAAHGPESRAKHEGNVGVVYLTGTMARAFEYAKTRAEAIARRRGYPTNWSAPYGPEKIEPVVLQVEVPDMSKLVADDDVVNDVARSVGRKIWARKSDVEKVEAIRPSWDSSNPVLHTMFGSLPIEERTPEEFVRKHGDDTARQMWQESEGGFAEIMRRLPSGLWDKWLASLKRKDQVGYRGRIAPKFLKRVV